MNQISPTKVLSEVAAAVPASCRSNMAITVLRQRIGLHPLPLVLAPHEVQEGILRGGSCRLHLFIDRLIGESSRGVTAIQEHIGAAFVAVRPTGITEGTRLPLF
jgi:hypothetical protein